MKTSEVLSRSKTLFGGTSELVELITMLREHVSTNPLRWLEVGYGDGAAFSTIIAAIAGTRDVSAVAIDPEHAYPSVGVLVPDCEYLQCGLGELNVGEAFDIVNARHSLYYVGELLDALLKIRGLVNNGGFFCLTHWSKDCSLYELHQQLTSNAADGSSPTFEEILDQAVQAGFSVVASRLVAGMLRSGWNKPPPEVINSIIQLSARGRSMNVGGSDAQRIAEDLIASAGTARLNGIALLTRYDQC